MTSSKYLINRIGLLFRISKKSTFMANAVSETHLLKETEVYLGMILWQKVEEIEALSMEYWTIRKLSKLREDLVSKLKLSETEVSSAYQNRQRILEVTDEAYRVISEKRRYNINKKELLSRKRDIILENAREVKKSYDALKTKHEVLLAENNQEDLIAEVLQKLIVIKSEFAKLKQERQQLVHEINLCESAIDGLELEMQERRTENSKTTANSAQEISENNQIIAKQRAELGTVDAEMRKHYSEIGRYLSVENPTPEAIKVGNSQKTFIRLVHALRKSIFYNQRLAALA